MGCPQQSVLASLDNNPLWSKFLEAQAKRKSLRRKHMVTGIKGGHIKISRRCRRTTIVKRRARLQRPTRPNNELERKVRTLKKLIPQGEATGLEGLFRETADYISALQMRVQVMQIMVNVLTGSEE